VLTVAVADAILQDADYGETIKRYARKHPMRGYGPRGGEGVKAEKGSNLKIKRILRCRAAACGLC